MYKKSSAVTIIYENTREVNGNEFIALDAVDIEAITIESEPNKLTYYIGDSLNTSGLEVLVTYSDGSTEIISTGFSVSGFSSSSEGTKTVTVSYEGFTDIFAVAVETPRITLSASSKSMTVGDSKN